MVDMEHRVLQKNNSRFEFLRCSPTEFLIIGPEQCYLIQDEDSKAVCQEIVDWLVRGGYQAITPNAEIALASVLSRMYKDSSKQIPVTRVLPEGLRPTRFTNLVSQKA